MIDLDRVHPAEIRRLRLRRDLAYACFFYFGAAFSAAFVWNRMPTDWLLYRVGAAVLSSPLAMAGFVAAGVVGVAYSLTARREPALWLLAGLTASVPLVLALVPRSRTVGDWLAGPFFVVLTLAALCLPLAWFVLWRRRWRATPAASTPSPAAGSP